MNQDNGGAGVIEIRIRELTQLFDSLDPSPFSERDLDRRAEEYIMSWARELPAEVPLRVYLRADAPVSTDGQGLRSAFANFFDYRVTASQCELKELFRIGRLYLSIGVPVLFICFAASQLVRAILGPGAIARALEESLIILGWVANWRLIETVLHDWWPIKRRRDLYLRPSPRRSGGHRAGLKRVPSPDQR
jgi:hypothetical protein